MAKKRLIKFAFQKFEGKPGYKELMGLLKGSTSLIFTKINILKLVKILNENKSKAPAKSGDHAPNDLKISEMDTGFPPGPIISELNEAGLATKVQSGTIHIKEEKVVAKKGDEISLKLALILTKLNIFPMEVGIILYGAIDNGVLFKEQDLTVDFSGILKELQLAHVSAFNLSLEIVLPTRENITQIIQKAQQQAKSLVISAPVIDREFINDIFSKVNNESNILISKIKEKDPNAIYIERPKENKEKETEKEEETT